MGLGARREVAEIRILAEIERDLLAPEAVEFAIAEMRRLWRQDDQRPAAGPDLSQLDRERYELERLVQAGTLSASTAAPALERIENQRRSMLQAPCDKSSPAGRGNVFGAELAYREVVSRIREVLQGSNIAIARDALRELLGEVPVRPAATGEHLEAHVRFGPIPLMAAVGAEREWVGSGGRI